jgi:hypothetical protein
MVFINRYYSLASVKQYGHSVETGQPKFANRLFQALILHQQERRTQKTNRTTLSIKRTSETPKPYSTQKAALSLNRTSVTLKTLSYANGALSL